MNFFVFGSPLALSVEAKIQETRFIDEGPEKRNTDHQNMLPWDPSIFPLDGCIAPILPLEILFHAFFTVLTDPAPIRRRLILLARRPPRNVYQVDVFELGQ